MRISLQVTIIHCNISCCIILSWSSQWLTSPFTEVMDCLACLLLFPLYFCHRTAVIWWHIISSCINMNCFRSPHTYTKLASFNLLISTSGTWTSRVVKFYFTFFVTETFPTEHRQPYVMIGEPMLMIIPHKRPPPREQVTFTKTKRFSIKIQKYSCIYPLSSS